MIHEYTTLDGHDPSKIRRDGEDQTIQMRVFHAACRLVWITCETGHYAFRDECGRLFEDLCDIADELEAEARPPAPRTVAAILHPIVTASTEGDLGSAWRDAALSLHTLTTAERQQITEAFITRLCVISQDDGR